MNDMQKYLLSAGNGVEAMRNSRHLSEMVLDPFDDFVGHFFQQPTALYTLSCQNDAQLLFDAAVSLLSSSYFVSSNGWNVPYGPHLAPLWGLTAYIFCFSRFERTHSPLQKAVSLQVWQSHLVFLRLKIRTASIIVADTWKAWNITAKYRTRT